MTGKLDSFAPEAKVIHVDIDPAEIGKNRHADVPIVGDVKLAIVELIEADARRRRDGSEPKAGTAATEAGQLVGVPVAASAPPIR